MESTSPFGESNGAAEAPAAEVLVPRAAEVSESPEVASVAQTTTTPNADKKLRHRTYRPSHRATFIGLSVVVLVLGLNAIAAGFVLRNQTKINNPGAQGQVTISQGVLNGLGVNRSSVGASGVQLTVNPDARFNGKVVVGGDVSVAGQFKLNSKFSAADATLTQLEAGNTSLNQLNVNGDGTASNFSLRNGLLVNGTTRLQGPVTVSQLLTVNNSLNVANNLTVGGLLAADSLSARSLVSTSTLTIGGHIITSGSAPSASVGGAVGTNGTISISGNDASGTVAVNVGTGAVAGTLVQVTFRNKYSNTPHVVVSPIGAGVGNFYVNRNSTGFNISVSSGLSPGGYAFDYIVEQ